MDRFLTKLTEIEPVLSAMVNLGNLADHEASMAEMLSSLDYHFFQIETIMARNRELMEAGEYHGRAMIKAVEEAGAPGGKRMFFWDDKLERLINEST